MSFSEQMRESLGAEGAKVEVEAPADPVVAGAEVRARVRIHGGTRPAQIDALVVRVIEARRHWVESGGRQLSEEEAQRLPDRAHLMPAWTRQTISETRVDIAERIESGAARDIDVSAPVPAACGKSSPALVVTLNAQADIKGQIDPTGNGRLTVV
jgi:sporulation-control protein spo0M